MGKEGAAFLDRATFMKWFGEAVVFNRELHFEIDHGRGVRIQRDTGAAGVVRFPDLEQWTKEYLIRKTS